tara:strand:- start:7222 stop:7692 length:471 start_codon:yes stop_codon:yes gene_type:complete
MTKAAIMEGGVITRWFGRPTDGPYLFNNARQHPSIVDVPGVTDEALAEINIYRITRDPAPVIDPLTQRRELVPAVIGGSTTHETWSVVPLTLPEQTEEVQANRRGAYLQDVGTFGDQFDAILKQFNQLRLDGTPMIQEMDDKLTAWLAVKAENPLP